ncbi:MAG: heme-binding protein [Deltaproteobacteria bacterium]|nr:heme-binding protein [Deltaproteobacteria bacterium]
MTHRRTLTLLAFLLLLAAGTAMASYDEPAYTVVDLRPGYEVRQYAPHIVAEVTTRGSYKASSSAAFRLLANYIFGGNQAPDGAGSKRMNMTVPVTGTPQDADQNEYVWTFYMEPSYTLDALPTPNDGRVRLVEVPARLVAVKRYSGRTSEANYHAARDSLRMDLANDGVETIGVTTNAVYNGPWTLPALRRNEVLQPVSSTR